jgi:bifunctional non-homologous end joining protein LigD
MPRSRRHDALTEKKPLTQVTFSNLDKILYPKAGITKGRMIEYYIRAAPRMLPFLHDRILVMNRFPEGVDGESFYEKDAPVGTPHFVDTFVQYSPTVDREIHYIVCNNLDTLLWVANLASIEINITLSGVGSYETPDMIFFDIDPEPPATFAMATETALLVREFLHDLGLRPYVKTSGKKGIHIIIPVVPRKSFDETRKFVHQAGIEIAKKRSFIVSEFSRSTEAGTVFIDYLQNAHGRTMICPHSLRATAGATVSTPIRWDELEQGISPQDFTIATVIPGREDPWKGIFEDRQEI